jgi:hypothetical protein
MRKCLWCGEEFDTTTASHTGYCSQKCVEAARAVKGSSLSGPGITTRGSLTAGDKIRGMKIAIPIIVIFIIIGLIGAAVNGIRNAFSDTKIDIVSASCETQEKFVSILKEAGVSGAMIEGEEFTTYSQQARDAVKERKGEYATFKNCVYFVRLPDSVNVYVWFETEDETTAYVYKTK